MEGQRPGWDDEESYLRETINAAERQLEETRAAVSRKQSEMIKAKKEIRENTEHGIGNLWSSEGFEALAELSQSIAPVTEMAADCDEMMRRIIRLENLIRSPYFARIDFRFEGDETAEKIYIGRTSLMEKGSAGIYVYDWRSPIAGVFYRFMTGEAFYDAPGGRITGTVERKRQYEIKNSRLLYFFDTSVNIRDEILKRLLSRNTSPKMKSIVETIQREQDIIIRDMENDLLMIQGVAGSGKTSIALHRAAYLMYQGLQSGLSANNILILSPNQAFERYISDVLPELGEENVVSTVFEEMLRCALKERPVQSQKAFLEKAVAGGGEGEFLKKSIRLKTSEAFLRILDWFVADIPQHRIGFRDVYFEGKCVATKEELKRWALQRMEVPLAVRLGQLEERILEGVRGIRRTAGREEKPAVLQEIQSFTRLDLYDLYRRLWEEEACFDQAGLNGSFVEELRAVRAGTLKNLASGCLAFDDAVAVFYLHLRIYGSSRYRNMRQVIIDEAQDYYPLQYEIFRLLFPNAKFTVLGDIDQTLMKQETVSFYGQVRQILDKKNFSLMTLDKSFRCTSEILQFALRFIRHRPELCSFNRTGDAVKAEAFDARGPYLRKIAGEVRECQEKGLKTICLLCKTQENCSRLFSQLWPGLEVRMFKNNADEALDGVLIMPSYMAKGLEFDAVVICDADAGTYSDEDDKKLLYMECTRALHRLSLFCEGEMALNVSAGICGEEMREYG